MQTLKKRITMSILMSTSAMAGGTSETSAQSAVVASWSGFYLGAQYSTAWEDYNCCVDLEINWEPMGLGAHFGYMHDFGEVIGTIEITYDQLNYGRNGYPDEYTTHTGIHARFGYDAGRYNPFFGVGYMSGDVSSEYLSSFSGHALSAGVNARISDNLFATIMYSHFFYGGPNGVNRENGNEDNTFDVLSIRGSYKF